MLGALVVLSSSIVLPTGAGVADRLVAASELRAASGPAGRLSPSPPGVPGPPAPAPLPSGSGSVTDGAYLVQNVRTGAPPYVGSQPSNVTYDIATGTMYVTDFGGPPAGNAVTVFDASNGTVVANLRPGDDPIASVYDPWNQLVYVMNYGLSANVSVFNGTTLAATIPVGIHPRAGVFDPRNGYVYVASEGAANVTVLNGTSIVATVPVGGYPTYAQVDPSTGIVAVPNFGSNNVSLIDGTRVVASIAVGVAPESIIYNPRLAAFEVVNSGSGSLSIIRGTAVVGNVSVGGVPLFAAYDGDNGYVYVPVPGSNRVAVVNNTTVVATVPAGNSSRNPCWDKVTGLVYVSNWGGGSVTVINGTTVRATVTVGAAPFDVTCDDLDGRAYVPVYDGGNVSILGTVRSPYSVGFRESGLPPATVWGATLGPTTYLGSAPNIDVPSENGTFPYAIPTLPGYVTYRAPGNVTVNGSSPSVLVPFHVAYAVTFNESGLTYGHNWTVTLNGTGSSTIGTSLGFEVPNGTFAYSITPIAGYRTPTWRGNVTVAGAAVRVAVVFAVDAYDVQFAECCLPSGTPWSVVLNGTRANSSTPVVHFAEPNGSYTYAFGSVPGYRTPAGGELKVAARGVRVNVSFAPLTYAVNFTETGLMPGTAWSVAIAGTNVSGTTASLVVDEPNGTYSYVVGAVPGFAPNRTGGSVTIAGAGARIGITFSALYYSVSFVERGLANGTSWSVTLGGQRSSSTSDRIDFSEAPGSYPYLIAPVSGYGAIPAGTVAVGRDVEVNVTFVPFVYPVEFRQSGLPATFGWNISVAGTTVGTSNRSLVVDLPNGSFSYRVLPVPGYSTTWSGSFEVRGGAPPVAVAFVLVTYLVTFVQRGLPNGTLWSIQLGPDLANATGPTLTFRSPNGTYVWSVLPVPGFTPPTGGQVDVRSGDPPPVAVTFRTSSSAAPSAGNGDTILLIGAAAGAAGVAGVVLLLRRRRTPREPGLEPPDGPEGGPPP